MSRSALRYTFIWFCVSVVTLGLHFGGVWDILGKELKDAFVEPPVYYCYTDAPNDIISGDNKKFFSRSANLPRARFDMIKNLDESLIDSSIAFTLKNNPNYEKFENHALSGYYTVGFLFDKRYIDTLADSHNQSSEVLINSSKIIKGFAEGKTWKDIGYKIGGDIAIKSLHDEGLYADLVKYQILAALTDKTELTRALFAEHESEINRIFDKMVNCTEDSRTIYIGCEQSQEMTDKYLNYSQLYYGNGNLTASIPVYLSWSNEMFKEYLVDKISDKNYVFLRDYKFRNTLNSYYSNAYNRARAIDSINMAIIMDY